MEKLFSESIQVDHLRSVSVSELADSSLGITGVTIEKTGTATPTSIRFSSEATEGLRKILNNWHNEKLDEIPF